MRLIDADALKKAMDGYWGICQRIRKPRNGETAVFLDVKATVEEQPTIDAVPVRHGKWILDEEFIDCSECRREKWSRVPYESLVKGFKYCPNCGARMDEK